MTKPRVILISVAALPLLFFVLWPTVNALRVRYTVANTLKEATSVWLEEFVIQIPLASVELPRAEWPQVLAAMPIIPDAGCPGFVKMCFVPHHRIVITDQEHQQFAFTVCFACDQAHTETMGIFATPYLWCTPLRRLFTSHGIRIRTAHEYGYERQRREERSPQIETQGR